MAKYYIQSGRVSYVVVANDAEGAALWAMHQTIEAMIDENLQDPGCDGDWDDLYYGSMLDGLARFGPEIACSEIGFAKDDAGRLTTDQVFRYWNQLRKAADHLFDQLN